MHVGAPPATEVPPSVTAARPGPNLDKAARDRRAWIIAEFLRMGHDPLKVGQAIRVVDAGGSVEDLAALRGSAP